MDEQLFKLCAEVAERQYGFTGAQRDYAHDVLALYLQGGPQKPVESSLRYHYPTSPLARVIAPFGAHNAKLWVGGYHMGVDLSAAAHPPVYAVAPGEVIECGYYRPGTTSIFPGGYGRHMIIQHDGYKSLYAHLWGSGPDMEVNFQPGNTVQAGQVIGHMGGDVSDIYRGVSGGPHLHFEIILSEKPDGMQSVETKRGFCVDPLPWLANQLLPPAVARGKVLDKKGVNLRALPSTSADKVGALVFSALVEIAELLVVDEKNTWARLRSLRSEWTAVIYSGVTLISVQDVKL